MNDFDISVAIIYDILDEQESLIEQEPNDPYLLGLYNGLELALATFEKRPAKFKAPQYMNDMQKADTSITKFLHDYFSLKLS